MGTGKATQYSYGGTVFLGLFATGIWPLGKLQFDESSITFRTRFLPWPYTRAWVTLQRDEVDVITVAYSGFAFPFARFQALDADGERLGCRGRFDRRGALFMRRARSDAIVEQLQECRWTVEPE